MKIGTITLSVSIEENELLNLMKVNNLELLFIQYLENSLYNLKRGQTVLGEHTIIKSGEHFNIIRYKEELYLQINSVDEEMTWEVLDEELVEEISYIVGFFNEDADSNTHFELTFDYIDSYKSISHDEELFPEHTDVINAKRSTWALSKNKKDSSVFELDKLTKGVWIDV